VGEMIEHVLRKERMIFLGVEVVLTSVSEVIFLRIP